MYSVHSTKHLTSLLHFSASLRTFICMLQFIQLQASSVTSVVSESLQPYGWQPARLLCPWDSPGKNTGVGCHALLQEIFPTQGLNPSLLCLLHWHVDSLPLVPPGHHVGVERWGEEVLYTITIDVFVLQWACAPRTVIFSGVPQLSHPFCETRRLKGARMRCFLSSVLG